DHLVSRISDHPLRLIPGRTRRADVAGAVLGFPGESLAHGVDRHLVREPLQDLALAGLPPALDELHDADAEAVADAAHHHAEGGRRLALALAGMDDQQALLDGLG